MLTLKVIREPGPKRRYGTVSCGCDAYLALIFLEREDRENFYVLHLDAENKIIGKELISCGTLTNSLVHPREVFKGAILNSSVSIILAHNHPSGNIKPSREDIQITHNLQKAGELLGIPVLDHIIIGEGEYFSFFDKRLLIPNLDHEKIARKIP